MSFFYFLFFNINSITFIHRKLFSIRRRCNIVLFTSLAAQPSFEPVSTIKQASAVTSYSYVRNKIVKCMYCMSDYLIIADAPLLHSYTLAHQRPTVLE